MKVEIIDRPAYLKKTPKICYGGSVKIKKKLFARRPQLKLGEELFLYKQAYKITIEEAAYFSFFNTTSSLTMYGLINALKKHFNIQGNFIWEDRYDIIKEYNAPPLHKVVYIYENTPENIEKITELTNKDKAIQQAELDRRANIKLMDTFTGPNVQAILDKYGMQFYGNEFEKSIHFQSSEHMQEFLNECIQNTLVKDLNELGIEVSKIQNAAERGKQYHFGNAIIKQSDMKMKLKENDDE